MHIDYKRKKVSSLHRTHQLRTDIFPPMSVLQNNRESTELESGDWILSSVLLPQCSHLCKWEKKVAYESLGSYQL